MKKTLFKNISFIMLSCIMITFILTGCGSSGFSDNDLAFRKKASKLSLKGSSITLMASEDWIKNAEKELGMNFEAATGIQVIYEIYPDKVYLNKLFEKLDSSNPPDLFMTQSGLAIKNTYHLDKYAVDLSDEPWMEFYDSFSAAETSIDGKNYGISYFDNTTDYYIVYNKKIFNKAGVTETPKTFSEFLNACRKIAASGVTPIYEPMADGWHQTMLFAETGQVFDKLEPGIIDKLNNNETTFAENANMKLALEQIQSLAQKGYMGKNFETDKFGNAISYMATGEYAMCMIKPGGINSIVENEMNNGFTAEDFDIMLLPICDNSTLNVHPTGPSKFICSSSKNIAAAKLYLEYITTEDSIQYVISNDNAVDNLPFNKGQKTTHNEAILSFFENFTDETSGLVLQDVVTYFNEQWGDVSNDILKLCKGEMTALEVLQAIDSRRAEFATAINDPAWAK